MSARYEDSQLLASWVIALLAIVMLVPIIAFIAYPPKIEATSYIVGFTLVLLAFIFVNFYKLKVKVTGMYFIGSFGIVKKRIRIKNIKSCKAIKLGFKDFIGYGIRIGWGWRIGFIARKHKAVEIKTKKATWVFSCNDPEAVCKAIKK